MLENLEQAVSYKTFSVVIIKAISNELGGWVLVYGIGCVTQWESSTLSGLYQACFLYPRASVTIIVIMWLVQQTLPHQRVTSMPFDFVLDDRQLLDQ